MDYEVNQVEMGQVFKVCPQCGYQDGFHSMFEKTENSRKLSWMFICPSCHSVFDVGLKTAVD